MMIDTVMIDRGYCSKECNMGLISFNRTRLQPQTPSTVSISYYIMHIIWFVHRGRINVLAIFTFKCCMQSMVELRGYTCGWSSTISYNL